MRRLPKGLFLFYFPSVSEAARVLCEGKKAWQGGHILMDVWHPTAGCRWNKRGIEEGRVWVYGLPVHLWGRSTFEEIGQLCGGLIDFETLDPTLLEWVSLRVRRPECAPEQIWLSDGMLAYSVRLWQQELPRALLASDVGSKQSGGRKKEGSSCRGDGNGGERREHRSSSKFEFQKDEKEPTGDRREIVRNQE